jgi:hypothetical protein
VGWGARGLPPTPKVAAGAGEMLFLSVRTGGYELTTPLRIGRDPNLQLLDLPAVERDRNRAARGCDWQFTAHDARVKLKRLYPSIEVR